MNNMIMDGICHILESHQELLCIPIRQKAKFEGWLKFELAYYIECNGFKEVDVETKGLTNRFRTDITFFDNDHNFYSIELKTSNTNWNMPGIRNGGKPLTKNIKSIIDDCIKLNSSQGIVAFILFPIPVADLRWETYFERIVEETGASLNKETNCKILSMKIDEVNKCDLLVCTFISRTEKHRRFF
jgi:hypothetical protein